MPDQPGTTNPHRLPRTAVPNRYDLVLEPDLDAGTFTGTVTIGVELVEPIEELVLHAAELEIDAASVTYADGSTAHLATRLDSEVERLVCTPASTGPAGSARVSFTFRGILNDKLRGFYRSTFTGADGVEHTLATSKQGVFAGGDIVTGAATVILAMGAGKTGARSIDRYLQGQPLLNDQEQEAIIHVSTPSGVAH